MSMLSHPFASTISLEHGFSDGLAAILENHPGLGVYILVLANAACDPKLWAQLAPALAARHWELAATLKNTLRNGQTLTEPEDDVQVFLKLLVIGFDHLKAMESRHAGPWMLFFNPIRALRPPRNSSMTFDSLLRPFDAAGFHFNKPFLAKEVFWEGELAGKPARLLYNKFPFAHLHGLLVPEPLCQTPQYLTPELHDWAWDICAKSGVPGFCLGYNSTGAGASVNHLHFQNFVQATPLPIQNACFAHNGGTEPYPLPCRCFSDAESAWLEIDQLHRNTLPYNLIYSKNRLHLVARVPQDSDKLENTCRSYGWSEMAGAVTLFRRERFDELSATEFEAELANFAP